MIFSIIGNFTRNLKVIKTDPNDSGSVSTMDLSLENENAQEMCDLIGYDAELVLIYGINSILRQMSKIYESKNIKVMWP